MPGGDTLEKLASMGMNVNWLLTGNGEMLLNSTPQALVQEPEAVYESGIFERKLNKCESMLNAHHAILDEHNEMFRMHERRLTRVERTIHELQMAQQEDEVELDTIKRDVKKSTPPVMRAAATSFNNSYEEIEAERKAARTSKLSKGHKHVSTE